MESRPSFCSQCGTPLEPNAKFCPKCGTQLGAMRERQAPPTQQNSSVLSKVLDLVTSSSSNATTPTGREFEVPVNSDGMVEFNCPICGKHHKHNHKQPGFYCKGCNNIFLVDDKKTLEKGTPENLVCINTIQVENDFKTNWIAIDGSKFDGKLYITPEAILFKAGDAHFVVKISDIIGYDIKPNPYIADGIKNLIGIDVPGLNELIQIACDGAGKLIAKIMKNYAVTFYTPYGKEILLCSLYQTGKILKYVEGNRSRLESEGKAEQFLGANEETSEIISSALS